MPRKSRKKSKSGGESDGKNEESTPSEKICQEREDQVASSSSNIYKPVIAKRQTRGSSVKSVSQDVSSKKASTDIKLLALLKKPGIQEILSGYRESASSTSTLSNFKIPRKKCDSNIRNDDTGPKAPGPEKASSSTAKPVQPSFSKKEVENEKKACKRKSEAICNADQITQSTKRGSSGVGVTKGKTNIQNTEQSQSSNNNLYETSALRPTIKARRTLPSSLSSDPSPIPPPPSTTTVDTPQMEQLKAQIASRKKKKAKTRISAPPAVYTSPLKSTPSRSNNSKDESCPQPQRSSEKVKARPSETQAIHNYNRVIIKNIFTATLYKVDNRYTIKIHFRFQKSSKLSEMKALMSMYNLIQQTLWMLT